MPLVTFKDLCIDAHDVAAIEAFWSSALHLDGERADDGAVLRGARPGQTVWINAVPEPKTVKGRVHLDLVAASLDAFAGLERVPVDDVSWTTFLDPEGNELCVFVDANRPPGLKDVVVDAADHAAIAAWWADLWGGTLATDDGYTYLDDVPGAPVDSFDFVPVPEPKTVKNRLHWDVTLEPGVTVDDLVARGAVLLARPTDTARWTVMADPEGNEFCVFDPQAS
ncbi:VOC family protein [Aeromicrobium sp. Root472D3]|uniref:VOC family protein n=1 Tax=Aeromicrobium sp. Root472D3 TaxID=1736540 RepID=UPI0007020ADE|nr:VOC family protein [Aeromicrobium sp. Root472D3]KQX75004.1 hypothetical protein ASD10_07290 [Aeromicrobium sp. Root472D3]